MKGRSTFSAEEIKSIRALLKALRRADRAQQKSIRASLRRGGFYITDFTDDQVGFTASDLDELVSRGTVNVGGQDGASEHRVDLTVSSPARRRPPAPITRTGANPEQIGKAGHRVAEEWMGEHIETLEDLLSEDLRAVCVGINPSPTSVEAGHYYQGPLGQKHFARLRQAGLLPAEIDGFEDDALLENGVGFHRHHQTSNSTCRRASARGVRPRTRLAAGKA